jgi:hypothetical protein
MQNEPARNTCYDDDDDDDDGGGVPQVHPVTFA